VKVHNFL